MQVRSESRGLGMMTQPLTQKLTEPEYHGICRYSRKYLISPNPVTANAGKSLEEDYLYTVWLRIAEHIVWENPILFHKGSESDVEWLKNSVHRLVADNQSAVFDIQPTLYKYLHETPDESDDRGEQLGPKLG
jgi:hypothetical protein